MKRSLVCGAGGFIGSHLVKALRARGDYVVGVDLHYPHFSATAAHDFRLLDLRDPMNCCLALGGGFDEVYQLAADMGGMGFISTAECEVMRNNVLINTHMLHRAVYESVPRYFFSSSVCVYRNMQVGDSELTEEEVYPAQPDNEYGWEKLYSERMAMAYERRFGITVRVGRFENCYGPEGTWTGGREKAPAALCRKVAEAKPEGTVGIWGNGSAVRCYTYVEDTISGILALMDSNLHGPVNISASEPATVHELLDVISDVAGKTVQPVSVPGPVGVDSRNFSTRKLRSTGWAPRFSLWAGIERTYLWIEQQVQTARSVKSDGDLVCSANDEAAR